MRVPDDTVNPEVRAGAVWAFRANAEREAELRFAALADDLIALHAPPALIAETRQAADDETDHRGRCARTAEALGAVVSARQTPLAHLGPSRDVRRRAIYTAVAHSCITESLSAGLLLAMRERVDHPVVRDTVASILRDEVRHARIGFAVLAFAGDVAWVGEHLPAMLAAALPADALVDPADAVDLAAWGVPAAAVRRAAVRAALRDIVFPGLSAHGVPCEAGRAWMSALE